MENSITHRLGNTASGARASIMVGAAAVLILAGCSAGTPAPTTGPTGAPTVAPTAGVTNAPTTVTSNLEACSLLTPAEVSAASPDYPLDTATPDSDSLYSYCKYTGSSGGQVRTWVLTDAASVASVFGTMKVNAGEAVSGVGDEAWWSNDSFQPGLYFLKGGVLGFISGAQTGPEDSIVALGVLMASRM